MAFCIQFKYAKPTQPCPEDFFYKVIREQKWKQRVAEFREIRKELSALEQEAAEMGVFDEKKKKKASAEETLDEQQKAMKDKIKAKKQEATEKKKSLPGFSFQSNFLETEKTFKRTKDGEEEKFTIVGPWRSQKTAILNGLCMVDVDHLEDPKKTYEGFKEKVDFDKEGIMLVYITPSGYGLKVVFKTRLEWGNLNDNQTRMAALLGVEQDDACKDAARLSYIFTEEDLLFINNEIFTYENKEYGERWNETYRRGDSKASLSDNNANHSGSSVDRSDATGHDAVDSGKDVEGDGASADGHAQVNADGHAQVKDEVKDKAHGSDGPKTYHGIPYHDIIDKWLEGRTPQEGDRHTTLLKLATQLRYICDRSTAKVTEVLKREQWVADYIEEDSSALTAIKDACEYKYSLNIPQQLRAVLAKVLPNEHQDEEKVYGGLPFDMWGDKIEEMMADYPCLRESCVELKKNQYPAALFASAAFFGTLMTRTWYHFYHHPEQERRLNYSVFIIGDPGSGKSFVGRLYNLIAAPIIMNDQVGNDAINRYKKEVKERGTSSKEQKKEALKQPAPIIRIHGTRTANGVFIEDMCNAVEIVGDKPIHLHMLTFDAELDASTAAAKGGQWIDKSTMELKAFHNEEDNQQYKNVDSVTGPFNVYWNFVYTGTPLSLDKKVTERNFGSGLSTRLACIPFPGDNLEMMEWQEQNPDTRKADDMLREWAFRLDKVSGELPIKDLVKTTWEWTGDRMAIAKINENKADGLLIKRIAYYGIAISMPFILMRHWEEWEKSKSLTLDRKDLELAKLVMNIQYECQRYFFGGYAEHYFDNLNSDRNIKSVKHKDKTVSIYTGLKDEFKLEDLYNMLDLTEGYIRKMVSTWMTMGYIERIGLKNPAKYRKLKKVI